MKAGFLIIFCSVILLISSCASRIGETVNSNNRGICKISTEFCKGYSHDMKLEWQVKKMKDGTYSVNGKLSGQGPTDYRMATFTLFLIKENVVVDEIGMVSGNGDFAKGIPFSCNLSGKDFDATTLGYSFQYK